MKITSRSILSPGRAGSARPQPPTTLTPSLSRRLKTSRSIKGGASPAMFPTIGEKRGSGFDNPEPSSPKVTCIGQVRVKSKKKHAKNNITSSLSRKRKLDHSLSQTHCQHLECLHSQRSNNQRWVHLPLTICEALRTFGSEVSCLFPCRSSCSNTNSNTMIDKEEKMEFEKERSCSDVFSRWLVAFNDHDDNVVKSRRHVFDDDIDNGNDSIMGSIDDDVMSLRRHVFDDLDIVNIDEGIVSICVPPKNALLLMRCRSDPMMMEALTNRFWEPNVEINEEEQEVEEFVDKITDQEHCDLEKFEVDQEIVELNMDMEMKETVQEEEMERNVEMEAIYVQDENDQENETRGLKIENDNVEDESMFIWCLFEEIEDQDEEFLKEEEEESQLDMGYALELLFKMEDIQETEDQEFVQETEAGESNIEKVKHFEEENDGMVTENEIHERIVMESVKVENDDREKSIKELPECLLLMMYEPKLSMEVSKETWVCSSDFIRHHSSRKKPPQPPLPPVESIERQDESLVKCSSPIVTTKECDHNVMRVGLVQDRSVLCQPGISSCSFATRQSRATVLEEKLVNTMGYEPFVLTRCKSEPMRIAEAKLKQDTCYWKNKLEPPRRASFSISMSGLGF
ncbi:hypothetical protein Tco_0891029 [Tanacetum coccineum]|uniref:Uncharacterized protein n=1 Tax=Tanacetum coccineum TaxID=301880 RepID=A0ABQ5C4R6_9ASTR